MIAVVILRNSKSRGDRQQGSGHNMIREGLGGEEWSWREKKLEVRWEEQGYRKDRLMAKPSKISRRTRQRGGRDARVNALLVING